MLAIFLSCLLLAAYLVFYTAYSKKTKQLDFSQLVKVLTVGDTWDFTLVELNKAISLSGLTGMLLAFLPGVANTPLQWELLWLALLQLWAHTVYSSYKYYGTNNIPYLSTFPEALTEARAKSSKDRAVAVKKASVLLGLGGQLALSAGFWHYISVSTLAVTAVGLGMAHFYTMEVDFKWKLQVRPFAYLPFPMAALALLYTLRGN